MFVCRVCEKKIKVESENDLKLFLDHVAICRSQMKSLFSERFSCSLCDKLYKHKHSLRNHIRSVHLKHKSPEKESSEPSFKTCEPSLAPHRKKELIPTAPKPSAEQQRRDELVEVITVNESVNPSEIDQQRKGYVAKTKGNIQVLNEEFLEITTKIFGKMNGSMEAAKEYMNDLENLLESTFKYFVNELELTLKHLKPSDQTLLSQRISDMTDRVREELKKMNTEHKVAAVLSKKGVLQLPEKRVFDETKVQIGDSFQTVKSEVTILPIEHQITSFLERPKVLETILEYQEQLAATPQGEFQHFLNGDTWKEIKKCFGDKIVIPIFLYNDDFGPDDSCSPHGASNKISAFYYNFPSLPPEFGSSIKTIFVAMLALYSDIKECGVNVILKILADELKPLVENGISVHGKHIYIAPVSYLGDNLGLNLNMGYTSPTSTYFCRTCFIDSKTSKTCCEEKEELLRTKEHYLECVNNIGPNVKPIQNFGVVFRCDLNDLVSFKVYWNYIVDIMHDLLLGIFILDIVEILKKAVNENLFSLHTFNTKKNEFDWGSKDVHQLLEDISKRHIDDNKIRGHASEVMVLVRYLPFILSGCLPTDHELFQFALIMVDLLDIVLKTRFTTEDLNKLERLTRLHNEKFLSIFKRNLTPKAHYILHYARVIRNSGPLKYIWCMRFEAKHQELKAYAKVCFNRRNLPFSLGKKICFNNAIDFTKTDFLKRVREFKEIRTSFHDDFNNKLKVDFKNCSRVNYNGRIYTVGDFIISDCFKFTHKICQIAVDNLNEYVMLITDKYGIEYTPLFRTYKILGEISHSLGCYNIDDFVYPSVKKHSFNGFSYIKCEEF